MGFAVKGRVVFGMLILLIVLVLMVIGYLADLLFSLEPTGLARDRAARYQLAGTPYGATNMATAETLFTVGAHDETRSLPTQTAQVAVVTGEAAAHVIPTLCDTYGREITSRDAYAGPVTYWAEVAPDHVVFHLNTIAQAGPESDTPSP